MELMLLAGSAHPALGNAVARALGLQLGRCVLERFPDGEMRVEVREIVRGTDVYLLEPTGPPAEAHLLEILLLADACRRGGASSVTAVAPYFGYARQDRVAPGVPLGAAVARDLLATRVSRIVAVDLHGGAVEADASVPLVHLCAIPALISAARSFAAPRSVVVSPDQGALGRANRIGEALGLPIACVRKERTSAAEVRVEGVSGEVRGLAPILVDDIVSTAGTIEAAVRVLLAAGCAPSVSVVATHGLLVGPALERLRGLPLQHLVATDSLPPPPGAADLPLEVVSLAPLLAETVRRLHRREPTVDLEWAKAAAR